MRFLPLATLCLLITISGCSGYSTRPASRSGKPLAEPAPAAYARPCPQVPSTVAAAFDCDRRSILAMAGEFRVSFAFDETAALAPGYVPHAAQRSAGTELVIVIADTGPYISLQHILVLGNDHSVVKHWRQDWQYQPDQILSFVGNGHFEMVAVDAADARGAWSQSVYEVDDAPRYAAVGCWSHADGADAWESQRSLRPLPRREYTKRNDYQALAVVNRHTLTPSGWVHEQDNTKLILRPDGSIQALAREHGVNGYTRTADYEFSAGRDYWTKTAGFWAVVRKEWQQRIVAANHLSTSPEPNGEPRIEAIFSLAERAAQGQAIDGSQIRRLIERYTGAAAMGVVASP